MAHLHVWHDSLTCLTQQVLDNFVLDGSVGSSFALSDVSHDSILSDVSSSLSSSFLSWQFVRDALRSRAAMFATRSYVWLDSSTCVTWLIHKCDMPFEPVMRWSWLMCVTWLTHMCEAIHLRVRHACSCRYVAGGLTLDVRDSFVSVSGLIRMRDMTHSHVWHVSFVFVTWLIRMCDMIHSYVWHDSFICVTWLILMCGMTYSHVWLDSFICVMCLIYTCDMAHSYVWHNLSTCVTWLIRMCDMTHLYVWHDSFICVTWLIYMCDMTHLYMWHDLFIRAVWVIRTCDMSNSYVRHESFIRVTRVNHMCDMMYSYVWHGTLLHARCAWSMLIVCDLVFLWFIRKCDMTHPYMWHDSFICVALCVSCPCERWVNCGYVMGLIHM